MNMVLVLALVGAGVINAAGSSVMKYAMTLKSSGSPNVIAFWLLMLLSVSLYGGCFPLYAAALAKARLSVAQPIFSAASYLAVALTAVLFFNEPLTVLKTVGLAVIVIGIVMVAR
jgi:multidrug transporter EmrE-like cation transporter